MVEKDLDDEVDNFHTTDDRKASEKSHGSSNRREFIYSRVGSVFFYLVKWSSVKIDSYKF